MFSDWFTYYWPQILSPFHVCPGIYNLPWLYIFFQPLRLVGKYPGVILVQLLSILVILKLAYKLQLPKWRFVMVLSSAPVVWHGFMGQIDGMLLAAYLTVPVISAFLFLCKPQTNLGALVTAARKPPALVAAVLTLLAGSAWLVWGWPISIQETEDLTKSILQWIPPIISPGWNWSFWPWGFLLLPLWKRFKDDSGLIISPFLFPYAGLQSLIGPVLFAAKYFPAWALILTWMLLWLRLAWMLKFIG